MRQLPQPLTRNYKPITIVPHAPMLLPFKKNRAPRIFSPLKAYAAAVKTETN